MTMDMEHLHDGQADALPLVLSGVCRAFREGEGQLEILRDANLALNPGELVALVAPSGAGKSTLLHIAGLLERPDSGEVLIGGVALVCPGGRVVVKSAVTAVKFKRLSRDEVDAYLVSEEWRDKAGGYAIQGRAALFVTEIHGDYNNVVGLPLALTAALLTGAGAWSPAREG